MHEDVTIEDLGKQELHLRGRKIDRRKRLRDSLCKEQIQACSVFRTFRVVLDEEIHRNPSRTASAVTRLRATGAHGRGASRLVPRKPSSTPRPRSRREESPEEPQGGASRRGSAALAREKASGRGRTRPSRSPVRRRRISRASAERRVGEGEGPREDPGDEGRDGAMPCEFAVTVGGVSVGVSRPPARCWTCPSPPPLGLSDEAWKPRVTGIRSRKQKEKSPANPLAPALSRRAREEIRNYGCLHASARDNSAAKKRPAPVRALALSRALRVICTSPQPLPALRS